MADTPDHGGPTSTAPHAREAQMFPRLDAATIERLRAYGTPETPAAGSLLFERGARGADFFVVLAGAIDLFDSSDEHVSFRAYLPGQFAGELHLFNDRALLITGRAAEGTELLRIRRQDFRRMVSTEADVGETIMRAFILRRVDLIATGLGGVTVVGSARASDTHRVRAFLSRNAHPYRMLDLDSEPEAASALAGFAVERGDLPVVLLDDGRILRNPSSDALATALGLDEAGNPDHIYDLVVVGGGPAGLSAAVYAASEGLSTVVVEREAPGGQAGTSSRIENYLGFPTGISGAALAGRAQVQAQKFGTRFAISRRAIELDCSARPFRLQLDGGETIVARAIVVATGARYRKLSLPGYDRFEGRGVYYAATPMEAQLCAGQDVVVVGGGNSAGQAAVFLSQSARHVHVLVRSSGLAATMSDYLVQRIENSPSITLHAHSEVTAVDGDAFLSEIEWTDRRDGKPERIAAGGLFVMIGADPNTDWLRDCLMLDDKGFIITGGPTAHGLTPFATSIPGLFAVGDVRSGSVKRVASGVGEGSVAISAVHAYLAEAGSAP